MKSENRIWELYASNAISTIEEIVNSQHIESIRETSLPHTYAKIGQFEQGYHDTDVRRWFIETLFGIIAQAEASIIESENIIKEPRLELLNEIKSYLKKTFKDLKISDKKLTAPEKIILFEYLGVLDLLRKKGLNETSLASLLTQLWGGSDHNLEGFIREINLPPGKGRVKNPKSLNTIKEVAARFKITSINQQIEDDLRLLKNKK